MKVSEEARMKVSSGQVWVRIGTSNRETAVQVPGPQSSVALLAKLTHEAFPELGPIAMSRLGSRW